MARQNTYGQAGGAAIGARLRRLSERIDREANAIYVAHGVDFEQRWYGVLSLLDEHDALSVVDAARHLGVTHVAVSQVRGALMAAGLVVATSDAADGRRRVLSLTDEGRKIVARLKPLWNALNRMAERLNEEAGDPSGALDRLEAALDRASLGDRLGMVPGFRVRS